jgi:pyrroloquinoline quinone biosynthesis protein D
VCGSFKADPIAAEVVRRCTGEACFETIVDDLAKTFGTPRERVLGGRHRAAAGLADKKLRVVRP